MSTFLASRPRGIAALVALALAAACTGDTIAPVRVTPRGVNQDKAVQASRSDVELMVRTPTAPVGERGETSLQLDAGVFGKKGKHFPNKNERFYEWVSADPSVATVDSTGLVTAVGVGTTVVIVDYKQDADTVSVSVVPVPVASVTAAGPDSLSLADTAAYTAAALDSVGEPLLGRVITWASSDPAALTIGATDGIAVANAVGTVLVTATSETKSATVTTKVWLQPVATIDVVPASQTIALYRPGSFGAVLKDRRGVVLTGRTVTWRSTATGVFTINGTTGAVTTVAPGTGNAVAESEGKSGTGTLVVTNPVEARALWVNRFDYTDAASIRTIMTRAQTAKFNIVYFQARAAGDAFYKSTIEPCAIKICGTLGGSVPNATPSFDPLATAIAEATPRGIEVHAWLNAYTGWIYGQCPTLTSSTPKHMLLEHPEYLMKDRNGVGMSCTTGGSEYIWVSPGFPGVRTQLARVAADISRRYAVKGIHLDRIRYPGTTVSYDTASVNAWDRANNLAIGTLPASTNAAWAEFRRAFVNAGVREVRDSIAAVNPKLVLSAAVWPIYKIRPDWNQGSQKGWAELYQDTQAWAMGGYLDVAVPMTYPGSPTSTSYLIKPTLCANLDWLCMLDDHKARIEGQAQRHMYIGVGAITGWNDVAAEIEAARGRGVTGMSVYNYSTLNTALPSAGAWATLGNGYFRYPATIPAMAWK